jgi:hypothetical protein
MSARAKVSGIGLGATNPAAPGSDNRVVIVSLKATKKGALTLKLGVSGPG